jgi:hypothetical protein
MSEQPSPIDLLKRRLEYEEDDEGPDVLDEVILEQDATEPASKKQRTSRLKPDETLDFGAWPDYFLSVSMNELVTK